MGQFLDQSKIDEFVKLQEKRILADSAKKKIEEMYLYTLGYPTLADLESLQDIGIVISEISRDISETSEYYPSFMMLKTSYSNFMKNR